MTDKPAALGQRQNLTWKLKKSISSRGLSGTLDLGFWKIGHRLAEWLLPSRYRERRLDREFDARFGVETRGIVALSELQIESDNRAYGVQYEQSKPAEFHRLLSRVRVDYREFVFVDLGSGKGRALLMASELPFKRIVGVEFAAELHRAAQVNVGKYQSPTQQCRHFELLHLDAARYAIPNEKIVFYLYNAFEREVMTKVLTRIEQSLREFPREVYLIYCNSRHRDLVEQFGFEAIELLRWSAVYKYEMDGGLK